MNFFNIPKIILGFMAIGATTAQKYEQEQNNTLSHTKNPLNNNDLQNQTSNWAQLGPAEPHGYLRGNVNSNTTSIQRELTGPVLTTENPTRTPTVSPTGQPTGEPTTPSGQPSSFPSSQPSNNPTGQPSRNPSGQPSGYPTNVPTLCVNILEADFTNYLTPENITSNYLNVSEVDNYISDLLPGICGIDFNLREDLSSCATVFDINHIDSDNVVSAAQYMKYMARNSSRFRDGEICLNITKGSLDSNTITNECNETVLSEKLTTIGLGCSDAGSDDDKENYNTDGFFYCLSFAGSLATLAGVVYLGANKRVGNGLDCCQKAKEHLANIADSARDNAVLCVIGAGTGLMIAMNELGDNNVLNEPEIAALAAIANAGAVAALLYKGCIAEKSVSAANNRVGIDYETQEDLVLPTPPSTSAHGRIHPETTSLDDVRMGSRSIEAAQMTTKARGKSSFCAIS